MIPLRNLLFKYLYENDALIFFGFTNNLLISGVISFDFGTGDKFGFDETDSTF